MEVQTYGNVKLLSHSLSMQIFDAKGKRSYMI